MLIDFSFIKKGSMNWKIENGGKKWHADSFYMHSVEILFLKL